MKHGFSLESFYDSDESSMHDTSLLSDAGSEYEPSDDKLLSDA